ncbi:MAG: peroxiredoxin [Dehalococcoidia bacterium]|jgi:peroxiredoxin|nr:peroxiredoxin [Dehalococcoidia bacterium]MDP6226303.1 peroxiredoxin [Dehalococcoidia bacterium]MDP7084337.1 peroxiredoxin [Dehalococcoidia bacterium]MDP7201247.1 peroxiredoxin [Dehalococcoidia bacterium]MDP7511480.1 peroxiredoxin [Dehalococcoidia bacterium]
MAVDVGQPAPEFSLYDTDRGRRSLGEFKGKNVVLAFFPGAFTGTCTTEMCALRDRADQFNSLNAQVLGISVDPPFSQKVWAENNELNFPVLSDFNREVVNLYDIALQDLAGLEGYVAAKRAVFVLDKGGVVRYKWVAPAPGKEPLYDEIKEALDRLA